jgi:two-component sensor histidine kinase
MRATLFEKETLLREIHHRVKNNLQVISGLLHFQAKKLRAPEDAAALAELRQRISAMTLVHERLYQAPDVARIDFGEYVGALVAELRRSFGLRSSIRIDVQSDQVRLPIEQALPSGMIVSELVMNVMKYAFPGDRHGTATVSVRAAEGRIALAVDDDGVGFPEGFDPRAGSTFGWELVRTLALQLDATVAANTGRGAHVRVSFAATAAGGPS